MFTEEQTILLPVTLVSILLAGLISWFVLGCFFVVVFKFLCSLLFKGIMPGKFLLTFSLNAL